MPLKEVKNFIQEFRSSRLVFSYYLLPWSINKKLLIESEVGTRKWINQVQVQILYCTWYMKSSHRRRFMQSSGKNTLRKHNCLCIFETKLQLNINQKTNWLSDWDNTLTPWRKFNRVCRSSDRISRQLGVNWHQTEYTHTTISSDKMPVDDVIACSFGPVRFY